MAKYIDYKLLSGVENMEFDYSIFKNAVESSTHEPILRFYGWNPACVTLGRNQTESTINKAYCSNNNIDITRRITGGRALLHQDELTYSFVCPISFLENESVKKSYEIISKSLIIGFENLGIKVEFGNKKPDTKHNYCMLLSTGADLNYNGKKIVGSAQYRANGYLLQHGSILFTINNTHIKNIFNEDVEDKFVTLSEIMPDISKKDLVENLRIGFEKNFNVKFM